MENGRPKNLSAEGGLDAWERSVQCDETGLFEMPVRRQRFGDLHLLHDYERRAVGQRPGHVGAPVVQVPGLFQDVRGSLDQVDLGLFPHEVGYPYGLA